MNQRIKTYLLIITFYSFLTLIFIPQIYLYNAGERPQSFALGVVRLALANYLWAAFTPLIFWFGERLPLEQPRLYRNLILHLLLSFLFAAFHVVTYYFILSCFFKDNFEVLSNVLTQPAVFFTNVSNNFIFYIGILAFNHAANYSRKYRDREFRLQQAQIEVLKMQLHPHFLFNTLNAISALIYDNPKGADQTVSQLSDLLRLSLKSGKTQEVTLKDELDFLRKYIKIQQTLLQERLEVHWEIDPETLDAYVPNMILQPLVENSIRHGIAPLERGGRVEIIARLANSSTLNLKIIDNGQGFLIGNTLAANDGLGLENTKSRLQHMYGNLHQFELNHPSEGGLAIDIEIPFREGYSKELK